MSDTPMPTPDQVIAAGDPGDETARRFRFQWTWAAVVCCMLLDDTEDVVEVFCEHHEDVLVKHGDGSFTGHQVKTRADHQPPWKAGDEPVRRACARFTKLESDFPGCFRGFLFLTNHPLHVAGNGQDIGYILRSISQASAVMDLPPYVRAWLRRIAREAGVSEDVAITAMSKVTASADLPKLRDATMRLIDTIAERWSSAGDCTYEGVQRAALALIDECCRASSLDHQQLLPGYLIPTMDANGDDKTARINGKRMTIARVRAVLEQGRDSTAMLEGDPELILPPGQGSTHLLYRKLEAGGFSAVSQASAVSLRDKADYLGIKWTKQFGNVKGLARYDHIRTLVLSDAGRAFDALSTSEDKFGPAMREDLRKRFAERRVHGDQLFDCTDDHLEGVAFSLTAQCKIMWSLARPWENQ